GLAQPVSLALDDTYIHWLDAGGAGEVVRATLIGANATPVATGQDEPSDIIVDGANVFWSTSGSTSPAIRRIYSGFSSTTDIVTKAKYSALIAPGPLASDDTYLYYGDATRLFKVEKFGSA